MVFILVLLLLLFKHQGFPQGVEGSGVVSGSLPGGGNKAKLRGGGSAFRTKIWVNMVMKLISNL